MVPLQLVLRSPVLGAKINALEVRSIRRYPERNPNKAPKHGRRIRYRIAAQIDFNRAILKPGPRYDCEAFGIIKTGRTCIRKA
jgi:hypothetical protein